MNEQQTILIGLTGILVLGMAAQWLAWRLRLPAILLLLLAGFLVGPVPQWALGHKWLDPDHLLGALLYPLISLSVGVILFEGGLTLNIAELKQVGRVLRNLVTIGMLVTWGITLLAARLLLGLSWELSVLLGAILVVTGPTVIGPLLRHVKPVGQVGPILKWEGIVIDPIGATLALLAFEAIHAPHLKNAALVVTLSLFKTALVGSLVGLAAAAVLVIVFRRFWIADHLQNPVALMFVVAAFTSANLLHDDAGLLAVVVMGVAMANQKFAPVKHVLEFKESLSILLVSGLFILLGSRLSFDQFRGMGWPLITFLLVLLFIARPAAVFLSTWRAELTWREKAFLSSMAPRGIVAAAVSSVFALRLRQAGYAGAERIVPVTFAVIISTVLVYGLSAVGIAQHLGLKYKGSAGFLIAGANPLARAIGKLLHDEGQQVTLVDTSRQNISAARLQGLSAEPLSILSEAVVERIDGTGIGRLLALTPNEEVNALAALHFGRLFGRSQVYQLAPEQRPATDKTKERVSAELRGRVLFAPQMTFEALADRLEHGEVVKRTLLTPQFTYSEFQALHGRPGEGFIPLFLVLQTGEWTVVTAEDELLPLPGQSLVTMTPATPTHPTAAPAQRASGEGDHHPAERADRANGERGTAVLAAPAAT